MTEILFIGRDDNAEALVQAALAPDSHALHRAHTVADASNLLSEQRFDVLIIDFDDASQGPGFDLAQLLGLFLFLPTIALLFDRLTRAMNQTRRYGQELAVLFIDLDRFKFVNNTMGHEAGDTVLKTVASRIRDCLRDSDIVARLGGDEFIVLVANLDHAVSAAPVANKIVESVSEPIMIGTNAATVSPSIGIALFPEDTDDADELMRYADAAMYQAKQAGGECYQFYRPDMNSAALRRIGLGVALQRAIRDNEFELHYQPQIDLKTGLAVGLEALVRWWHPECGLILPDQFIPLAEELA